MNKFTAIIILNPNIQKERIDFIQSDIINVFEQNTKIQKIWFLGKRKLEYKIKKYTDGLYLKLEIIAKTKKIEKIKEILKNNQYIIFSIIINIGNSQNNLPILKGHHMPQQLKKGKNIIMEKTNQNVNKVYMLVHKNLKLPFAESDILAISKDEKTILQYATKVLQEYIYIKGYHTNKKFRFFAELESELKKNCKIELMLNDNPNLKQQLLLQEKCLI